MLTRDMFAVANLLNCIICLFWLNVCLFNFVITGSTGSAGNMVAYGKA